MVALLETPAGFELNSNQVIGRVGEFITHRLQNYEPRIEIVPARKRGTEFSPENPAILEPLYRADMIFMGPGSPTYAVRQLADSLAWGIIIARHRLGAALALASAAVIAISAYTLPVYEIYKVGDDLHWKNGLNLFEPYGLHLVFIPHWNNNDGGQELDTSRCFMGKERFTGLIELLPPNHTVIGIDEKTGLIIDPRTGMCDVIGSGSVTLIHKGQIHAGAFSDSELQDAGLVDVVTNRQVHVHKFVSGDTFSLSRLGLYSVPKAGAGLPAQFWQIVLDRHHANLEHVQADNNLPSEVSQLVQLRENARDERDWTEADRMRDQLERMGWLVKDTQDGPIVERYNQKKNPRSEGLL